MKDEYDFSQGRRGAVIPLPPGQVQVAVSLDEEVLDWFRAQVHAAGGGDYSARINAVLLDYVRSRKAAREDGEPQPPSAA